MLPISSRPRATCVVISCSLPMNSRSVFSAPFEPLLILSTVSSTKPISTEPGCAAEASFRLVWASALPLASAKAVQASVSSLRTCMVISRGLAAAPRRGSARPSQSTCASSAQAMRERCQ